MNTTDDDKSEVEQDAGAVPAISTNTDEVAGWMNGKERTHSFTGLTGYNTQGMKVYPDEWYMTQRTWDRVVGYGKGPDERLPENKHGDETGSTGDGDL